jgi:hypothetical protein
LGRQISDIHNVAGGEPLAERVRADHVTVHRFTHLLADAARFARHPPGDR